MKKKTNKPVAPTPPAKLPPEIIRATMGVDYAIRHATFQDMKRCQEIAGQYVSNGGILDVDFEEEDAFLYVYVSEGEIRGYVQVGIFEENFYCIDDIAVDKKYTGKGVASALINFLFDYPKHIFLYVHTKNHRARKLYERLGFVKVCCVQRFYSHDRDAFKMVKPNDELGWIDLDTFDPIEKPASS